MVVVRNEYAHKLTDIRTEGQRVLDTLCTWEHDMALTHTQGVHRCERVIIGRYYSSTPCQVQHMRCRETVAERRRTRVRGRVCEGLYIGHNWWVCLYTRLKGSGKMHT